MILQNFFVIPYESNDISFLILHLLMVNVQAYSSKPAHPLVNAQQFLYPQHLQFERCHLELYMTRSIFMLP